MALSVVALVSLFDLDSWGQADSGESDVAETVESGDPPDVAASTPDPEAGRPDTAPAPTTADAPPHPPGTAPPPAAAYAPLTRDGLAEFLDGGLPCDMLADQGRPAAQRYFDNLVWMSGIQQAEIEERLYLLHRTEQYPQLAFELQWNDWLDAQDAALIGGSAAECGLRPTPTSRAGLKPWADRQFPESMDTSEYDDFWFEDAAGFVYRYDIAERHGPEAATLAFPYRLGKVTGWCDWLAAHMWTQDSVSDIEFDGLSSVDYKLEEQAVHRTLAARIWPHCADALAQVGPLLSAAAMDASDILPTIAEDRFDRFLFWSGGPLSSKPR